MSGPIDASDAEISEQRHNYEMVMEAHLNSDVQTTCSTDMRERFPACHQLGTMWCWATAVAAATEYYTNRTGARCVGLECDIVGWTFSQVCCPFTGTEGDKDACGDRGAGWEKIQKALNHFTGQSWQRPKGPLDKATLDATLQSGNPVIIEVGPDVHPNHVVTVHGCDGGGKYWFHDPEFINDPTNPKSSYYEEYFLVDYSWLLEMCYVWVRDASAGGQKLIACTRGSPKASNEIFRIESRWWDTLYVPP